MTFLCIAHEETYIATLNVSHPHANQSMVVLDDADTINITHGAGFISLGFNTRSEYQRALATWSWVALQDDRTITMFMLTDTDISPVYVHDIVTDASQLTIGLMTSNATWSSVSQESTLDIGCYSQHANGAHDNAQSARDVDKSYSATIDQVFNRNLFDLGKEDSKTAGLAISANAVLELKGILTFSVHQKARLFQPSELSVTVHPSGLVCSLAMSIAASGRLGTELGPFGPTIDIPFPAAGINIPKILSFGPYIRAGIQLSASAIEGTASMSFGAKTVLPDTAGIQFDFKAKQNQVTTHDWTPRIEKIAPQFSAEISASLKSWVELSIGFAMTILDSKLFQ